MTRPSLNVVMMANALTWAARSTCSSRVSVGAVLSTAGGRVVATGYNGSARGQPHCDDVGCDMVDGHCVRAIHAEENCILQCALYGVSTHGLIMFVTQSPCPRCCKRIIQAEISGIIFLNPYGSTEKSTMELYHAKIFCVRMSAEERNQLNEFLLTLSTNYSILNGSG